MADDDLELKQDNLKDVVDKYFFNSSITLACRILDEYITGEIPDPTSIARRNDFYFQNGEIIYFNDALDSLLDFYSLLEIGINSEFLPVKLNRKLFQDVLKYIGLGEVKAYCFDSYISTLPINLFSRFDEGLKQEDFHESDDLQHIFSQFIYIKDFIETESYINMLFKYAPLSLGKLTLKELRDPEFVKLFVEKSTGDDDSGSFRYIQGFLDFIYAVGIVAELLVASRRFKLINSNLSNYFLRFFNHPSFHLIVGEINLLFNSGIEYSALLTEYKQMEELREEINELSRHLKIVSSGLEIYDDVEELV